MNPHHALFEERHDSASGKAFVVVQGFRLPHKVNLKSPLPGLATNIHIGHKKKVAFVVRLQLIPCLAGEQLESTREPIHRLGLVRIFIPHEVTAHTFFKKVAQKSALHKQVKRAREFTIVVLNSLIRVTQSRPHHAHFWMRFKVVEQHFKSILAHHNVGIQNAKKLPLSYFEAKVISLGVAAIFNLKILEVESGVGVERNL